MGPPSDVKGRMEFTIPRILPTPFSCTTSLSLWQDDPVVLDQPFPKDGCLRSRGCGAMERLQMGPGVLGDGLAPGISRLWVLEFAHVLGWGLGKGPRPP